MSDANRVVFVVDDEPIIAETLAVVLNRVAYSATAFDPPHKTIEACAQVKPDLLISDVMMPNMIGSN